MKKLIIQAGLAPVHAFQMAGKQHANTDGKKTEKDG